MRRFLFIPFFLAATLVMTATPASADCAGPTVEHEVGVFDHGDDFTISGYGWGDNCYDTGPPPEGEGDLGNPYQDIDLLLRSGDVDVLIAQGAASENYDFEVTVTLPTELPAGPFHVVARVDGWGELDDITPDLATHQILDEKFVLTNVVSFGEVADTQPAPEPTVVFEDPVVEPGVDVDAGATDATSSRWLWALSAGAAAGVVLVVVLLRRS